MTDRHSFISVNIPGAGQGHPNPHPHSQGDQQTFVQGYPQQHDEDAYRRSSPSNVSYTGRSLFPPARSSSQAYGGPMSVQLPSLNGVFHDPTRSLYGPGTSALPPGSFGGPSPSDENMNTFRLPLNTTLPSPHPPSQYDYHPHHPQDFHHDRHDAHSQASYRNHPHLPEHPSTSVAPTVHSNSSPSPTAYPQSRQHHPHQEMVPDMMYNPHPSEPSSSTFNRSYASSGPQSYTHSHSSTSLSPQLETTPSVPSSAPNPVKNEDNQAPVASASSSRSTKRREKPKIELAADQPLTTQGKPRARVYVACLQCRTRKIRCDGAKPVCHNCARRQALSSTATSAEAHASSPTSPTSPVSSDSSGPCCYDAAPKRRGPDKNPGSRQRISHAQRDLEIMGLNGTAEGGKVKRRRRRDTNAVSTATAAATAGVPSGPNASSSLQDASPIDKQSGSGMSRNSAVRSNPAGGAVSEIPTDGAAHSPVSMNIPSSSSSSVALGHAIGSGAVSGPISGPSSAIEPIPPSNLHVPPRVASADEFGQQTMSHPSGAGHMRSPELYRALPGQMRVPQGMAHQLGPPYSHTTDPRISAERTHPLHREGHAGLQPDGMHRVYPGHDEAYSSMPTRLQVQVPSQDIQQQFRSLRTDVPRLISPAQEYPHTLSHHPQHTYQPQDTSHTPTHVTNILGYLTPLSDVPPLRQSTATVTSVEDYENDSESARSGAVGATSERAPEIGTGPSVQFAREIWWDTLISLYYSRTQSHSGQVGLSLNQPLSPGLRESIGQQITADLKFLFRASNYWFSFVNVPRFFSRLLDPGKRLSLQPSLVLAALACANLIRSSEQEAGQAGREWSLTLLSLAQAALDASTNSQWIDESLVQASWMIVFFEVSAHPAHNGPRVSSALTVLDNLIGSLSMSVLDRNDQRASQFGSRTVPIVSAVPDHHPRRNGSWSPPVSALLSASPSLSPTIRHPLGPQTGSPNTSLVISANAPSCVCNALTLGHNWRYANDLTPLWLMTPAWAPDASDPEIRKEECRRVVWSSVTLVAGYTSYVASLNAMPQLRLSLMDASNFALLFPGETLSPALSPDPSFSSQHGGKSTVWALYMRIMLLWHSCIRMRWDTHQSDASKAEFAVGAWLEIDRIENALNSHNCGVERAFLFQGREYLFNARMCISYEFQRFIPHATANANMTFHRRKAEEWLTHQAQVAKQTMYGLQSVTHQPNVTFARRPFFVFWFMSQVSRALLLWSCDNSLTVALEVSKALLGPIEYLMSIWPCPEQQVRYRNLRIRLDHACLSAGIPPPLPHAANLSHTPLPS